MSTKSTPPNELKQLQDDEAFINSLYQEIDQSDESSSSEMLDKRIISAAHKAVSDKAKQKKNKKFTWYHTLATAASLTLVVTLVFHQQSNVLPPIEQSYELADESIKESSELLGKNDTEMMRAAPTATISADTVPQAKLMTYARKNAAGEKKERQVNTQLTQIKSAQPKGVVNQEVALYAAKPQNRSINSIELKQENTLSLALSDSEQVTSVKLLTHQMLLNYKKLNSQLINNEKYYWSLRSEQNNDYNIMIFSKESGSLSYRLPKVDFTIDKEVTIDDKQIALDKITIKAVSN